MTTTAERKPVTTPPKAKPARTCDEEHKERVAEGQKRFHNNEKHQLIGRKIHQLFVYLVEEKYADVQKLMDELDYSQGTVYQYLEKDRNPAKVPHITKLKVIRKWLNVPTDIWERFLSEADFSPSKLLTYSGLGKKNKSEYKIDLSVDFESSPGKSEGTYYNFFKGNETMPDNEIANMFGEIPPKELIDLISREINVLNQAITALKYRYGSTDNDTQEKVVELNDQERARLKVLLDISTHLQKITKADINAQLENNSIVEMIKDDGVDGRYTFLESKMMGLIPYLFDVVSWMSDTHPIIDPINKLKSVEELKAALNRTS